MKQKPFFSILLLILLAISIFFNFTLYQEQKIAKEKIEKFLPAAVQVENEMTMLKSNNKELVQQLTMLQMQMDSSKKGNPNYSAIAPSTIQLPPDPQPAQPSGLLPVPQQGDYNDLQRPKKQQ